MIELHPAIVHFPIALLTIAALFGLISLFTKKEFFKEVAFWNLLLGVIGAIAAVLTGLIQEQTLVHNEEIHQILVKHEMNGFIILILSFTLLTWAWVRKNKFTRKEHSLWVLFLLIGTSLIFYQGFLGGKMVFEHGAGVKPMEIHMQMQGDSTNTHGYSNSVHKHNNVLDTLSSRTFPEKLQHHQVNPGHEPKIKLDTSKKQDSSQEKEKKKELKDMKY
jgi:uncharacterized membrane protein